MATNNPAAVISAAFPAPPPFYKSFTPSNIALLASHQEEHPSPITSTSQSQPAILPPELRNLVPPPPPIDGKYRTFGVLHDVSPSQAQPQTTDTPPPAPTPQRLLSITHNILLTFLSLTHALASSPSAYGPVWDQLCARFEEAHAIVNEYRPHQARETLISMMEAQVERAREETRRAREMGTKVKAVLEGLAVEVRDGEAAVEREGDEEVDDCEEKRVWEAVGKEMGFVQQMVE